MDKEEQQRETVVAIGIGSMAILFLVMLTGVESIMNFVLNKFILLMANAFLIVTLLDIAKSGVQKKRYGDYATFIIIGALFMFVYAVLSHQTAISMIINSLEYVVYILVIAGIVKYLKREING